MQTKRIQKEKAKTKKRNKREVRRNKNEKKDCRLEPGRWLLAAALFYGSFYDNFLGRQSDFYFGWSEVIKAAAAWALASA